MSAPQHLWHLKNNALFRKLTAEQMQRLETCSRARSFAARSPIYLPSESADNVFVLASGLVKVCNLTGEGKQSILAFIEPGELFGELALFEDQPRDEYVESVQRSTVVMIPARELQSLMAVNHDVSIALTKVIGLRRHRVERRLKHLMFLSNRDRLIHLLLDLAEQFGIHESNGIRLRIKLAHQELANLMGSTRETVTILLGQLKAEGLVDGGRREIVLAQADRLANLVCRRLPPTPQ